MRCPECGQPDFYPGTPCQACEFNQDAELLEKLSNLKFLLGESGIWVEMSAQERGKLRQEYSAQLRAVERQLGLRPPALDAESARQARLEMRQLKSLLDFLPYWVRLGLIELQQQPTLTAKIQPRIAELEESLFDAPPTPDPSPYQLHLTQMRFRLATLQEWERAGYIKSQSVYKKIVNTLEFEIQAVEIELGLRPAPTPAPQLEPEPAPTPKAKPALARLPRPHLTREKFVETLLSERTLQAILFLGATLLFAAAVSLVVWNWEAFPPWLQVTFLALNTGLFYFLGWYARTRMDLRGSGITLSAVASLLVPLDFYAVYLSRGFPQSLWPQVWLLASLVCLAAYLLTIYMLLADFFGYLVGLAAGSSLLAAFKLAGVHPHAWQAAILALALVLALVAEGLLQRRPDRWLLMAYPFWRLALVGAGVVLALASAWLFSGRISGEIYRASLALDWWLAGALFSLAARRFSHRTFALLAGFTFPTAILLTQDVLFSRGSIASTWHPLGLALLVPIYFGLGRWLSLPAADSRLRPPMRTAYARIALGYAIFLTLLAALWSLADPHVAILVHPLLAATLVLVVRWWQRPRLAYFASLLLLSGSAAAIATRSATLAQLGLAWSLLAILHVIVAIRLDGLRANAALEGAPERSYAAPVYASGWLIAGVALLPPLFTRERGILTYVLGNWIALNGWLALQAQSTAASGLHDWLVGARIPITRRSLSPLLFHWSAALPLLPWLWLAWPEGQPAISHLWSGYALLGWGLLILGSWLKRLRRQLGPPWLVAAHLAIPLSVPLALFTRVQVRFAAALLLAAFFYLVAAHQQRQRVFLLVGGLLLPFGWVVGLDWLEFRFEGLLVGAALLPLAYEIAAHLLGRRRLQRIDFYKTLRSAALIISGVVWIIGLVTGLSDLSNESQLLWIAMAYLLLAARFILHSWLFSQRESAHAAIWLGALAGGFLVAAYSHGTGRSAVFAGLLATVYVLTERGLYWWAAHPGSSRRWRVFARKSWRIYQRPLLVAGWAISVLTIGLACWRNLVLLGGGRARETWSILALLLVAGLYAASARLFRHKDYAPRFLWLAAVLIIAPWTLMTHQGWYLWQLANPQGYALSWTLLALGELLVGVALAASLESQKRRWVLPTQVVAHLLLPFALLWGASDQGISSLTWGLGVVFYLLAVWIDRQGEIHPGSTGRTRFLYPAAFLTPLWALFLLSHFAPNATGRAYAWLILAFPLPALYLGRRLEHRWRAGIWPRYQRPVYLLCFGTVMLGILLAIVDNPTLIGALLLATLAASLAAWMFHQPLWLFPACAAFPAAVFFALVEWQVPADRHGWVMIAVSFLYLLLARRLEGVRAAPDSGAGGFTYTGALQVSALILALLWLPASSHDRLGAAVGYGTTAALYAVVSAWLRQPLLLTPAAILSVVPYAMGVLELQSRTGWPGSSDYGLAMWPGIVIALLLATFLDRRLGIEPDSHGQRPGTIPWYEPGKVPKVLWAHLARWWALPIYALAYGAAFLSMLASFLNAPNLALAAGLSAGVYALAASRFRLRIWMLAAAASAQVATLGLIAWLAPSLGAVQVVLAFTPIVWVTALLGLYIQRRLAEGSPFSVHWWRGWSRPLYLLVAFDIWFGEMMALFPHASSQWVTLSHALLIALLATAWSSAWLVYLPPLLGLFALVQHLTWVQADQLVWPWTLALLALGYGAAGYLLHYVSLSEARPPSRVKIWDYPLRWFGWVLSALSLLLALILSTNVFVLAFRAIFSLPLLDANDLARVQMDVSVLSILGLFFLIAAITERRRWLGYTALGMLLAAWSLELLLVWGQREVQWYAIPAGVYLLGVGYLEWTQGGPAARNLARWIDRAALLLLLGSSFWQSLGPQGGRYALLMGVEGVLILWWGSARRLRRFLYAGVIGVTLDVAGQLVEPLLSANRWIVFGVAGVLLVGLAMLVERRLDAIVTLSQEMRTRLERWQ